MAFCFFFAIEKEVPASKTASGLLKNPADSSWAPKTVEVLKKFGEFLSKGKDIEVVPPKGTHHKHPDKPKFEIAV